jgi:hypothetical protein
MRTSASVPKALLWMVADPICACPSVMSNRVADPAVIMFWIDVSSAGVAMKCTATEMLNTFRSAQLEPGQPALLLHRFPAFTPPTHLRRATGAGRPSSSPCAVCARALAGASNSRLASPIVTRTPIETCSCCMKVPPLPWLVNATGCRFSRRAPGRALPGAAAAGAATAAGNWPGGGVTGAGGTR